MLKVSSDQVNRASSFALWKWSATLTWFNTNREDGIRVTKRMEREWARIKVNFPAVVTEIRLWFHESRQCSKTIVPPKEAFCLTHSEFSKHDPFISVILKICVGHSTDCWFTRGPDCWARHSDRKCFITTRSEVVSVSTQSTANLF